MHCRFPHAAVLTCHGVSRGEGAGKLREMFRTAARAQVRFCGILLAGLALRTVCEWWESGQNVP